MITFMTGLNYERRKSMRKRSAACREMYAECLEPEKVRQQQREREPHSDCIDSWGSGQVEIEPGQWCPGVHPLKLARTTDDLELYPGWPDMSDPTRVAHVREQSKRLAEEL